VKIISISGKRDQVFELIRIMAKFYPNVTLAEIAKEQNNRLQRLSEEAGC